MQDNGNSELSRIKEALKDKPTGMTVTGIAKAVGMNRHSAAKYLDMLVVSGHVDMRMFGPSKVFYLSTRVPISMILSLSSDIIVILDKNLRVVNANDSFLEFIGVTRNDIIGRSLEKARHPVEFDISLIPHIKEAIEGKESRKNAFFKTKGKEIYYIVKFIPTVFDNGENGATVILEDITERKITEDTLRRARDELEERVKDRTIQLERANEALKAEIEQRIRSENALRESKEKFRKLVENRNDWVWEVDPEEVFVYSNPRSYEILGYRPDELIGIRTYDLMEPKTRKVMYEGYMGVVKAGKLFDTFNAELIHKDGHTVFVEVCGMPSYDSKGNIRGYIGITRDITGRRMAEEALRRSNRAMEVVTLCNRLLVRATDEKALLEDICRVIVEIGGYSMAWIGLAEADEKEDIHPVAKFGRNDGYLDVVALPLVNDGRAFGALTICSANKDAFDSGELKLLKMLADDISYCIGSLRARACQAPKYCPDGKVLKRGL